VSSEVNELNFVANARLKDIVGRGLITNDNIALIELIKNSKDANSSKVEIIFNNADKAGEGAQVIIRDFGRGMSFNDIKEKWLNIAYSSKKNKLKEDGRAYAGNKGVGRFSCDRLGTRLDLYTIQKDTDGCQLSIDWEDYEVDDSNIQISDNKLMVYAKKKKELEKFFGTTGYTSGTVLVISNLRSKWGFDELKKLKKELEKFVINPSDELSVGDFDVYLETNYLSALDKAKIDGLVENKIFDKLNFKTTSILSCISEDGKTLKTTLAHDGNDIFTIEEINPYSKLKNIKAKIFYLNQASKVFFAKKAGYKSIDFGSIFLFLNGFRVFPYGEPDNDWLKLDKRKAQGYMRYLGTRDLVGYIVVDDHANTFSPVSAREGLVSNEAFVQLTELEKINSLNEYGFISKAFRKLEKFVVDGLNWHELIGSQKNHAFLEKAKPEEIEYKTKDNKNRSINNLILKTLSSIFNSSTKKENITDIIVSQDYLLELAKKDQEAYEKFYNDLKSKLDNNIINLPEIIKEKKDILEVIEKQKNIINQKVETNIRLSEENEELVQKVEEKTDEIKKKEIEVEIHKEVVKQKEKEVQQSKEIIKEKEKEVEVHKEIAKQKEDENLFLRVTSNQDTDALRNLLHKTSIDVNAIRNKIATYRYKKNRGNLNEVDIDNYFTSISYCAESILKVADLATAGNYRMKTGEATVEVISFIKDYIKLLEESSMFDEIKIIDKTDSKNPIIKKVIPLELFMAIDNIINNSIKAGASEIIILSELNDGKTVIKFIDNGNGLNNKADKNQIFNKGYTTTSGSGLGLYHVKDILNKLDWEVKFLENLEKGFGLGVFIK